MGLEIKEYPVKQGEDYVMIKQNEDDVVEFLANSIKT